MNLARFEPWSIVDLMNHDLDRFTARRVARSDADGTVADWTPAVDIIEENQRFVLHADVPGVSADDIDVSMDGGVLSVSGQRQVEELGEGDDIRRSERRNGRFFRRFTLPDTADAENITAKSKNGILEVVIPKQAEVKPRRISVEAA
jgi:HSP20 family protein